ncbi:MAG: tetraacyldisaccharide 4'-kinase [Bacteroidia bacterium]
MKVVRILAFPFSILYGLILLLRNKLYDWGVFKSTSFSVPVISVGNLSVGGTGKTPHIEYLIRLLGVDFQVATLSRGYGRKTKGFLLSNQHSTASDIGDEPLQFASKYPKVTVAVDEKRVRGIKKLLELFPKTEVFLLDDAFQHRAVKPGLSIVLTDFSKPYFDDYVLPSGTLREFRSGIQRADIIVVTKCPQVLLPIERTRFEKAIQCNPRQSLCFSYIAYGEFVPFHKQSISPFTKAYYFERHYSILLFTGIANTEPLEYYLKEHAKTVIPVRFPDHHSFTVNDIENVRKIFDNIAPANKILLTTEKDAMRLKTPELLAVLEHLPLFYIPIEIEFHQNDKNAPRTGSSGANDFNKQLLDYVRTNQRNSSLH